MIYWPCKDVDDHKFTWTDKDDKKEIHSLQQLETSRIQEDHIKVAESPQEESKLNKNEIQQLQKKMADMESKQFIKEQQMQASIYQQSLLLEQKRVENHKLQTSVVDLTTKLIVAASNYDKIKLKKRKIRNQVNALNLEIDNKDEQIRTMDKSFLVRSTCVMMLISE